MPKVPGPAPLALAALFDLWKLMLLPVLLLREPWAELRPDLALPLLAIPSL